MEEDARIKKEKDSFESGASTKGTNTPAGRKEKHGSDREAINKKTKNLKIPNSPNQSEASGTETAASRKKLKKKQQQQDLSTSPAVQPPSRPTSPPISATAPATKTKKRKSGVRGEASDTDAAATSDGGRKAKKIKIENGASSSRPTSPPPPPGETKKPQLPFPTEAEISAAIPPDGILNKDLIDKFKGRHIKEHLQQFINITRSVAVYDKEAKIWKRKKKQ